MAKLLTFILIAALAILASQPRALRARQGVSSFLTQLSSSGLLFLLLGIAAGPRALGLIKLEDLLEVRPLVAFGLGLGGLLIGFNLHPSLLKAVPNRVYAAAGAQAVTALLAVALPAFALFWLAFEMTPWRALGAASLLGAAASLSSAHLAAIWARTGRLERREAVGVSLLAILDDVAGLLALAIALAVSSAAGIATGSGLVAVAVLLGLVCGGMIATLVRGVTTDAELTSVALGSLALVAGAAAFLRVSALIAGAVCGTVLCLAGGKNIEKTFRGLTRIERPAYLILVFLIGAHAQLNDLRLLAVVPLFVAFRSLGKVWGGRLARAVGGPAVAMPPRPGYALLAQGPLALLIAIEFLVLVVRPTVPMLFDTILLGAVFNELLATQFFRSALWEPPQDDSGLPGADAEPVG